MAKGEIEKSVFGDKVVFIESSISHKSMSGMVILFVTQQHNDSDGHKWDEKDTTKLRYSKIQLLGINHILILVPLVNITLLGSVLCTRLMMVHLWENTQTKDTKWKKNQ